ncbi:MAG: SLC13 family permease [Candidatus Delongbacteria bacterium]|jgi:di/tricarboxylate transporter|nr:SLC13 family permease [Candidatus Delongbacteria bacterium]
MFEHFESILVFVVLIFMMVSLYREWVGPALTFMLAVVVFGLAGILTPSEMLKGFANQQIAVILMLLLIGDTIRKTGVLENFFNWIFVKAKSYNGFLWRMMSVVSVLSAFMNNTPLVAILMPYVHTWSKKNNFSPSKLLIPLSYAAILGGCATLIGTSTNLIVNGMIIDQTIVPDMRELHIFDYSLIGFVMIVLGILYMMLLGKHLLPDRRDVMSSFNNRHRKYLVEAEVIPGRKLNGKTIEEAGLRNLEGLFLAEIYRDEQKLTAVGPKTVLRDNDVLIFAGATETIADMVKSDTGLRLTQVGMFSHKKHTAIREIVISHNSSLIGKTIKEAKFRGKYDAAIIAVHRNGQRISGKLGAIELEAGDVLLLLAGEDFAARSSDTMDFYPITKVRDFKKQPAWKNITLIGGTALAILLSALGFVKLFIALLVLLIIITITKIINPKDIAKSLDYNLAAIIALALAIGTAMVKSGVAEAIANFFITQLQPFGVISLMFGIYIVTAFLSAYITNKAAVAIIFPIAITIAVDLGVNPIAFVLLVSFAAAASFLTPVGYQTNLMVYGPGSYSFKDFFKVGLPLTILYMFVTVYGLAFIYQLF